MKIRHLMTDFHGQFQPGTIVINKWIGSFRSAPGYGANRTLLLFLRKAFSFVVWELLRSSAFRQSDQTRRGEF